MPGVGTIHEDAKEKLQVGQGACHVARNLTSFDQKCHLGAGAGPLPHCKFSDQIRCFLAVTRDLTKKSLEGDAKAVEQGRTF